MRESQPISSPPPKSDQHASTRIRPQTSKSSSAAKSGCIRPRQPTHRRGMPHPQQPVNPSPDQTRRASPKLRRLLAQSFPRHNPHTGAQTRRKRSAVKVTECSKGSSSPVGIRRSQARTDKHQARGGRQSTGNRRRASREARRDGSSSSRPETRPQAAKIKSSNPPTQT